MRTIVSYKQKQMHEVLVKCLFKLVQTNVLLGELTVPPWPQLLTRDVKQQNKQNKQTNKMILMLIDMSLHNVAKYVNH